MFFRDVLGRTLWTRQAEIATSVAQFDRTAVRSGHKIGKSLTASGLALWFVTCFEDARAIFTSASARQVRTVLWRELRTLYNSAAYSLGGDLHDVPDLGLQFADGREIVGFSTDDPERFGGISGRNLLFIVDESSGVPEPIFEAMEGNRAGGGRIVLLGNPTRTSGTFYDAFHSKRMLFKTIHVSSADTPNAVSGQTLIPGLATKGWVEEKKVEWGEQSPMYQVRVAGNFAAESENAVIGLALVETAARAYTDAPAEGVLNIGVDVARYGDDESVIRPRRGLKALPQVIVTKQDGPFVAGKVLEVVGQHAVPGEKPRVKVDVIGVGASVVDSLKGNESVETIPVNVAEAPTSQPDVGPGYSQLRDQLWFGLRDWFRAGGAVDEDSKLEAELVAPTYGFDNRNRIKVEPKDRMKARLGRSPDRAEALMLSVYEAPTMEFGKDYGFLRV